MVASSGIKSMFQRAMQLRWWHILGSSGVLQSLL